MAQVSISEDALRDLLKQAVADALDERRDLLREVVSDALEDLALAAAIREGRESEIVRRDDILDELGRAA